MYVDAAGPVFDALEAVTPAWRTYLRFDSAPHAGWATHVGALHATRGP